MRKGDITESHFTKGHHAGGVPFLVSPLLLRSHNLGQIDIAVLEKNAQRMWVLRLVEIKYSLPPSRAQWWRLKRTQDYLSRILEIESKLEVKFCQKDDDSLSF